MKFAFSVATKVSFRTICIHLFYFQTIRTLSQIPCLKHFQFSQRPYADKKS